MFFVRLLERTAFAVLLACGPALAIVVMAFWRPAFAGHWAQALLACGFIAGLAWGFYRPPTLFAAALKVDAQLKLAELLSSAWLAQRTPLIGENAWGAILIAQADAACRTLSGSALRFRKLGGRFWGAVALALTTLVILQGLGPNRSLGESPSSANARRLAAASADRSSRSTADVFASADNRPIILADPDDPNASKMGDDPTSAKPRSAKSEEGDSPADSKHDVSNAEVGQGGGAARTEVKANDAVPPANANRSADGMRNIEKTAAAVNGSGTTSNINNSETARSVGSTSANGTKPPAPAPPWGGSEWSADVRRAQSAIAAGHVPAAYRDLVRGYFEQ